MQKYKFFIGIDVSKSWIDVSYYNNKNGVYVGRFDNTIIGFENMLQQLSKSTKHESSEWFICFENTGIYSKLLLTWLYSQAITCKEENALQMKRSMGIKRGHHDILDSKEISVYAYIHRERLEPSKPVSPQIKKLRELLSRRALLVRHQTAFKISFKEQKSQYEPELKTVLSKQNKRLLEEFKKGIKEVDTLIKEMIKQDEKMSISNELVQSVKGIGPVISAYIIAVSDNFKRFKNARQFSSYCGVAPFPNSSGSSYRGPSKVSHIANKQIKSLLSNGASSAIQFDKEIRLYYLRKLQEGKETGTVINAVKNKLIGRIFAVVKRGTPWVPMATYV